MAKVDIAYYPKETSLFSPTKKSHSLFIVIKGIVHELQEDVVHNLYIEGDSFDADALLYEKVESSFVVVEDLICYEIKRDDFLELLQNKKVQNYFLQNFISRHQHLKEYAVQNDLTPFLMAKVSDIFLHNFSLSDADS
ncbi:MAG: cyclic nucleotide-binding domain-containing protein, partial [Campylobacterota bacterium]|nr:cyclic nucleotide-binding domain-containing protein [Campylobacterota bacterium]